MSERDEKQLDQWAGGQGQEEGIILAEVRGGRARAPK